jgi:hypothetical protein
MHRNILRLSTQDTPYTTIVEPWADEFTITPAMARQIAALHPGSAPSFEVELHRGPLFVTVLESGSTYEFWRGTVREFQGTIPIPYSFE